MVWVYILFINYDVIDICLIKKLQTMIRFEVYISLFIFKKVIPFIIESP